MQKGYPYGYPLHEKSARRDSNPRPRPWQGRAPPTEPLAHIILSFTVRLKTSDIIPQPVPKVKHFFYFFIFFTFLLYRTAPHVEHSSYDPDTNSVFLAPIKIRSKE